MHLLETHTHTHTRAHTPTLAKKPGSDEADRVMNVMSRNAGGQREAKREREREREQRESE